MGHLQIATHISGHNSERRMSIFEVHHLYGYELIHIYCVFYMLFTRLFHMFPVYKTEASHFQTRNQENYSWKLFIL